MGTFDRTPYINQFETFMSESLSRADGYNPEVRLAYRNYLNGAMPQRIESFRNMVGKKERDFYASKAKVESGRMLENGNFLGYEALQRSQLDAGNIEQPEYDYLIGGMQVDSLLMQADRSMDMLDIEGAITALNRIDEKSLDDNRRGAFGTVRDRITAEKTKEEREAYKENLRGVSKIKSEAIADGVAPEQRKVLFDQARDMAATIGKDDPTQEFNVLRSIDLLEESMKRRDEAQKYRDDLNTTKAFEYALRTDNMNLDLVREKHPTSSKEDTGEIAWWQKTIKGKNRPSPPKSVSAGVQGVSDILASVRDRSKDKLSAAKNLMELRYHDESIDDQTYKLAYKRIFNDYSPTNSTAIDDALTLRETEIRDAEHSGWFYTPMEKNRVAKALEEESIRLYEYVDEVIKQDENHIFKPDELNDILGQIRATTPKPTIRSFGPTAPVYQQKVPQIDINTEPQTYEEFYQNVSVLKAINYEQAIEYNAKWGNKWSE